MDKLNKKCEVHVFVEVLGWECLWKSAKCIEQEGSFIQLAPYCKSLGKYDEELACWYNLIDQNYRFTWR